MRISLSALLCLLLIPATYSHSAGIQIGRTRIIYDASKKETALSLANKETELPWLIQSWTDTGDGKTRGPFIVTPPLFRLDPQKEQNLRITWTGEPLPQDRESLFYMNVRTIPAVASDDDSKNVLRLIYKTRLKLFWRPKDLAGTPKESCEQLRFSRSGGQLNIVNNGAYHTVFDSLFIGNVKLGTAELVAPKNHLQFTLPANASGQTASWRCITDYGNASEKYTATITQG